MADVDVCKCVVSVAIVCLVSMTRPISISSVVLFFHYRSLYTLRTWQKVMMNSRLGQDEEMQVIIMDAKPAPLSPDNKIPPDPTARQTLEEHEEEAIAE